MNIPGMAELNSNLRDSLELMQTIVVELREIKALLKDTKKEEMSLGERHMKHYQHCNCLGDKAECCDPKCCGEK